VSRELLGRKEAWHDVLVVEEKVRKVRAMDEGRKEGDLTRENGVKEVALQRPPRSF